MDDPEESDDNDIIVTPLVNQLSSTYFGHLTVVGLALNHPRPFSDTLKRFRRDHETFMDAAQDSFSHTEYPNLTWQCQDASIKSVTLSGQAYQV